MKPLPGARASRFRAPLQSLDAVERARRAIEASQRAVETAQTNLEAAHGNLEEARRIAAKANPAQP